jgi:hypothetical protein
MLTMSTLCGMWLLSTFGAYFFVPKENYGLLLPSASTATPARGPCLGVVCFGLLSSLRVLNSSRERSALYDPRHQKDSKNGEKDPRLEPKEVIAGLFYERTVKRPNN